MRAGALTAVTRLLVLFLLLAAGLPGAAREPGVSPEKLEALKSRISQINEWLTEAREERGELTRAVRQAEQEISRLNASLRELDEKLARLESRLNRLRQEQEGIQKRLQIQREGLKAQLRAAWMQGEAPGLRLLLSEEDPQELARTMIWHEYLSKQGLTRLKRFETLLEELRANRQAILDTRESLARNRSQRLRERQALEKQQQKRQQALAGLKKDIASRRDELADLKADRKRLEQLLRQVEDAVAEIQLPADSTPFAKLRAKLPWPARGKVAARYGERASPVGLRRNGMLIAVDRGEPVRSVHHGRVVFANWLRSFGLLLIVDHGGGYMSLYGHNESLLKSVGDWVRAGEIIALAGDSGGADRAGLYFEIRQGGKPQNPTRWLAPR